MQYFMPLLSKIFTIGCNVLFYSNNMGTSGLPDMHTHFLRLIALIPIRVRPLGFYICTLERTDYGGYTAVTM